MAEEGCGGNSAVPADQGGVNTVATSNDAALPLLTAETPGSYGASSRRLHKAPISRHESSPLAAFHGAPRRRSLVSRAAALARTWWRALVVLVLVAALLLVLGVTRWHYLGSHAWIALATTAVSLVALGAEVTQPPAVFLGAMAVIVVTGTLTLEAALSGFATPLVFAIGGMYALSCGIRESTLLGYVSKSTNVSVCLCVCCVSVWKWLCVSKPARCDC